MKTKIDTNNPFSLMSSRDFYSKHKRIFLRRPMEQEGSRVYEYILDDVYEPPRYNWWTRLNLKRKTHSEIPSQGVDAGTVTNTHCAEKAPLGLKLSTFHRTLKKDDNPAQVESMIRKYMEDRRGEHEKTNKMRKAEGIIKKDLSRQAHVLVAILKKSFALDFVKYGRVIKGRRIVGIFESTRSLRSLATLLKKRGSEVLWEGKCLRNLFNFKVVKYNKSLRDSKELFFYRSILIKVFEPLS